MNKFSAYIDETGDPDFNESASKTFFVCATIIKSEDAEMVSTSIEEIRLKNDLHELKSSRISSDKRRNQVLEQLSILPLSIFTILIEKNKLNGDWFRYRGTFYKFIQRCLVTELYRVYGQLDATFDRFGKPHYQESFKKYMHSRVQLEMFIPQIEIGSAKTNNLIQICDIVGGSIRKYYDGEYLEAENILGGIWKGKLRLPGENLFAGTIENSSIDDLEIKRLSIQSIDRYLSKISRDDEKEAHQKVSEYLKQIAYEEPEKYSYRAEIRMWLQFLGIEISDENLSRNIISELRDEGVILASSGDGIKIPSSIKDIDEHYRFMLGQAVPTLKRLKILDQVICAQLPQSHEKLMSNYSSDVARILSQIHL